MHPYRAPAALLDELGITEPSEIILEAIAYYCGVTVVYEPLAGCEARILGNDNRAIVTVNSDAPRERQRFSGAHELGHWMRDRGKVAFACAEKTLLGEWNDDNPERRANRYAADLLLPRRMFEKAALGMPPTFASAQTLARAFETSLTAAAIRLVELGALPAMIVCTETTGRRWFFRSKIIPESMWPLPKPGPGALATKLLADTLTRPEGPETVDADEWIDRADASKYALAEDSIRMGYGVVLTLLWWKNEAQLVDEDDDGEDAIPLSGDLTFERRVRRR